MTEEEKEFAAIIEEYDSSFLAFNQVKSSPIDKPMFTTVDGLVTMDAIKKFKLLNAAFEEYDAKLSQAREKLKAAKAAIDAWFPEGVKPTIEKGTFMISPAASGVIGLVKKYDSYWTTRAESQGAATRKLQEMLAQRR